MVAWRACDGLHSTLLAPTLPVHDSPVQFLRQAEPKDGKEAVNRDILQTVRQTFMDADEDGSGQLAPNEFVQAFTG